MAPVWKGNGERPDFQLGEILGYISMIVSLSMIFFGVKSYRDNHLAGKITFGKAFQTGIGITLVASVIYVAGWMVYFHTSDSAKDFPAQYLDYMVEKMQKSGQPQAEIDKQVAAYQENMSLYTNPLVMMAVTLFEIFPVGLVISLISAAFLKRKNKQV
jgi:hypothetical protein